MIKAVVFGASGYTGIELIRILSSHPEVAITSGSSRNWEGKRISEMFPFVAPSQDFQLVSLGDLIKEPNADVAFLALPHGESTQVAEKLHALGIKVIDLSADLRLDDAGVYGEWYGTHSNPDLLSKAVYGLPEINRTAIRDSILVANPGCYPQTAILGLMPLLSLDSVDCSRPIIDSKSGISGAGRGAKLTTSFCESGEGFKPYGVVRHRHIPEMEQELSKLACRDIKVRFTPHLIPISRGMVSTIYVPFTGSITYDEIRQAYTAAYENEPFVRILPKGTYPDTVHVRGSNQCHISFDVDERTGLLIVMVAIDNLVKGASGSAVQNMNLMMGFEETSGLMSIPLYP